jgi:transposase
LLTALTGLNEQLAAIDKELAQVVRADAVAPRLCTVPGIGPITALTFVAVVDDVVRFGSAKEVRAYVGLVPREMSSREQRPHTHHWTNCLPGSARHRAVECRSPERRSRRSHIRRRLTQHASTDAKACDRVEDHEPRERRTCDGHCTPRGSHPSRLIDQRISGRVRAISQNAASDPIA